MERKVPVWSVLLLTMILLLFAVSLAWAVRSTMKGSDRSGAFGSFALAVAEFPRKAVLVFSEVAGEVSGTPVWQRLVAPLPADRDGFAPLPGREGPPVEGLVFRRGEGEARPGWRLLTGAFTVDGRFANGAVLLDPEFGIAHFWPIDEAGLGSEVLPEDRKLVHGLAVLRDGSVVASFDNGSSLQRIGACGARMWAVPGSFHHAVTAHPDRQSVWALLRQGSPAEAIGANEPGTEAGDIAAQSFVVEIAVEDGETLRSFSLRDVADANPAIDPLQIRIDDRPPGGLGGADNPRNLRGPFLFDPFHTNDVDPLPARLAERFEGFQAGDLLLSLRSLNLVMAVDPESLAIRWWRSGLAQRQHDPDWHATGEITILDNRMFGAASAVVAVDPASFKTRILFDGTAPDVFSRARGKHQVRPDGAVLIASSHQARAIEVDPAGQVAVDILNTIPGRDGDGLVLTDFAWIPPDFFDPAAFDCGA
ncbi:MAG: arylsulfotransferase family protein [Paracoccaceae bacterium]